MQSNCFSCHQPGHSKNECRDIGKPLPCQLCDKLGHTKLDCPNITCNYCHKKGHSKLNCAEKKNVDRRWFISITNLGSCINIYKYSRKLVMCCIVCHVLLFDGLHVKLLTLRSESFSEWVNSFSSSHRYLIILFYWISDSILETSQRSLCIPKKSLGL